MSEVHSTYYKHLDVEHMDAEWRADVTENEHGFVVAIYHEDKMKRLIQVRGGSSLAEAEDIARDWALSDLRERWELGTMGSKR